MRRIVTGLALGAACVLTGTQLPHVAAQFGPAPNVIHSISLASDGPVHAGEAVEFAAVISRTEICAATVNRFIWNVDTGELAFSQQVAGNALGIVDHGALTFSVHLPASIPSGRYRYESFVYNECSGRSFVAKSPVVFFSVE